MGRLNVCVKKINLSVGCTRLTLTSRNSDRPSKRRTHEVFALTLCIRITSQREIDFLELTREFLRNSVGTTMGIQSRKQWEETRDTTNNHQSTMRICNGQGCADVRRIHQGGFFEFMDFRPPFHKLVCTIGPRVRRHHLPVLIIMWRKDSLEKILAVPAGGLPFHIDKSIVDPHLLPMPYQSEDSQAHKGQISPSKKNIATAWPQYS
mmetsp:Transcript_16925/g.25097  ORF Transcript_16925/g.25097 Transcript_16925/m.25097 type:complete len:207 (+) Transcript_16925:2047-2667(+)